MQFLQAQNFIYRNCTNKGNCFVHIVPENKTGRPELLGLGKMLFLSVSCSRVNLEMASGSGPGDTTPNSLSGGTMHLASFVKSNFASRIWTVQSVHASQLDNTLRINTNREDYWILQQMNNLIKESWKPRGQHSNIAWILAFSINDPGRNIACADGLWLSVFNDHLLGNLTQINDLLTHCNQPLAAKQRRLKCDPSVSHFQCVHEDSVRMKYVLEKYRYSV